MSDWILPIIIGGLGILVVIANLIGIRKTILIHPAQRLELVPQR